MDTGGIAGTGQSRIVWGSCKLTHALKSVAAGIISIPMLVSAALPTAAQPALNLPVAVAVSETEADVIVYESDYFAPYRPTHAKDMLERVPGAAGALTTSTGNLAGDADRRGLRSQTTQILINGKRLTTKGNSIQDYFERIPASQVERIEVIRGNVREIDAGVGSRVINIVLAETGNIGGTWSLGDVLFTDNQNETTLAGSINGETRNWSYTLSGETRPRQLPRRELERFDDGQDMPFQEAIKNRRVESRRYVGRGRVAYSFGANHQVQLSGYVEDRPIGLWAETEFLTNIDADGTSSDGGGNFFSLTGEDLNYEVSGDYTAPLSQNLSFKGLFVYSVSDQNRSNEDFTFINDPDFLSPDGGDTRDEKVTEKILRGTVDWAFTQTQSLEVGVEGTINTLDKTQVFFDTVNGARVDLSVFNADQVVTEDRVEAFGSHTWRPSSKWEIETGLAVEFSWLDQLGSDVDTNRTFKFAKPSLDVWYNAKEATQVFVSLRRDVGQLNFEDFISDLDREDDEIDAGNPDLAPEKSWDIEIGTEHRLANQAGVMNLRAFYRDVSGVSDKVLFGLNDSAPGNLGSGKHYGAELETSLQLRQLGLIDAVISSTFLWQDSNVEDPFTGLTRRFAKQNRFKLSVDARHDVQTWNISYGAVIAWNGPKIQSNFDTFERETTGPDARLFFEKRFANGIIGRLFWGNVIRAKQKRTRTVYTISQADGAVDRVEFRYRKEGSFYGFSFRGTF